MNKYGKFLWIIADYYCKVLSSKIKSNTSSYFFWIKNLHYSCVITTTS